MTRLLALAAVLAWFLTAAGWLICYRELAALRRLCRIAAADYDARERRRRQRDG